MPPTSPLRTAQPLRPTSFSPDLILFLRRQLHSISSPTPQLARSSKPTRLRSLFRRKSSSLGGHILRHPTPRRHNGPPQTFFTHYQNNKLSSIRHFTQHPSLLHLISGRPVLRPQLPFLHNPSAHHHQYNNLLNQYLRIKRHLLSTETKARWKRSVRGAVKLHLYFWPGLLFLYLLGFGYHQTWLEHEFPTVREWSFWNRWTLRLARAQEFEKMEFDAEGNGAGGRVEGVERVLVNWKKVGGLYGNLLDGLEDVNGDGRNVLGRGDDGGEIYVDGVGRTGWDVSMKSEPWRRGYWEALMGAGRAAERLEGMVVKKRVGGRGKWHITWGYWNLTEARERETVLGPSNPRPRPLAKGEGEPWNEDEVEDAFPPAEKFYLRILTTKGFSSAQKVDAALAYADWCDYKKLPETAEGIFDWAMDIAIAGAESQGSPTADVVDRKTGVVHTTATDLPSANILKVSTALGVHFAQSGDLKKALPVFLSVLKARRELPPEPVDLGRAATDPSKKDPTEPPSMLQSVLHLLKDWFIEVPYPPAPPSGDAPPYHTLKEACEEVGLMTYIGEILYASGSGTGTGTSASREKGLGWTRDAVDAAEAVMWVMREEGREAGRGRCQSCLKVGLANWKAMVRQLGLEAENKEKTVVEREKKGYDTGSANGEQGWGLGWLSPFGGDLNLGAQETERTRLRAEAKKWRDEEEQVELRMEKTMPLTLNLRKVKTSWLSM